jgi:hypothetical protein
MHLEFDHAFAQIFTDSLIQAMARTADLESRLGPVGKVSARFLIQLNLLDELGFSPTETPNHNYTGNPKLAQYIQFRETLPQLKIAPEEIVTFRPSLAAEASRRTFTDYFEDYDL